MLAGILALLLASDQDNLADTHVISIHLRLVTSKHLCSLKIVSAICSNTVSNFLCNSHVVSESIAPTTLAASIAFSTSQVHYLCKLKAGRLIGMIRRSLFVPFLVFIALLLGSVTNGYAASKLIYVALWRGCEEVCNGFQDYVSEKGLDTELVLRDAAQDKTKLPGFLKEAREMKADLILSWGTSVTLGIAGTLEDQDSPKFNNDIPQVFTVVADPVGARIIESLVNTGRRNITGTFNRVPEVVNINTIRSYKPTFKRLGLLYNTNEPNSLQKRDEIMALSKALDFDLVALELKLGNDGYPQVDDIQKKVVELKDRGVDFIYLGSSSFLRKNGAAFTGAAVENGIPVLSPYENLVRKSDALLSIAARYYDLGKLAGEQAEKILMDNKIPGDIPVLQMTDFAYVINMKVAQKLNLYPPVEILQFAETVN
ncbi:ABC transporter substrate-binding protein [Sneathiella sp. CAU 1612]|uniref:ABC transporter substrate-binding protein n=1 Tax=Sneathiella sedimenti TaxID=2816034 RepID=A0ABS3F9C2_9PROT|nr:ABC transporter substrate-binding protein [Sneathiella sedimenti]MBO0334922.1 ABC transporter substrate-binding protein [Sneathiella sedimenti]